MNNNIIMVNMNILNCRYFIVTDDETCDLSIYSAPCTKGKCIIIIKGNDRVINPFSGQKSVKVIPGSRDRNGKVCGCLLYNTAR